MIIPRRGMKFVVRRGKAKRKVTVVIDAVYRRRPVSWARSERMQTCHWYEVFYRTYDTWANHGRRNSTLRSFMQFAKPL